MVCVLTFSKSCITMCIQIRYHNVYTHASFVIVIRDFLRIAKISVKKQSETAFTASVLKKDPETHKRLKERLLIRQNRTKRAIF